MVNYKVILDMDPGIDDAIAIIIALQSVDIEVLGISTCKWKYWFKTWYA